MHHSKQMVHCTIPITVPEEFNSSKEDNKLSRHERTNQNDASHQSLGDVSGPSSRPRRFRVRFSDLRTTFLREEQQETNNKAVRETHMKVGGNKTIPISEWHLPSSANTCTSLFY